MNGLRRSTKERFATSLTVLEGVLTDENSLSVLSELQECS